MHDTGYQLPLIGVCWKMLAVPEELYFLLENVTFLLVGFIFVDNAGEWWCLVQEVMKYSNIYSNLDSSYFGLGSE